MKRTPCSVHSSVLIIWLQFYLPERISSANDRMKPLRQGTNSLVANQLSGAISSGHDFSRAVTIAPLSLRALARSRKSRGIESIPPRSRAILVLRRRRDQASLYRIAMNVDPVVFVIASATNRVLGKASLPDLDWIRKILFDAVRIAAFDQLGHG